MKIEEHWGKDILNQLSLDLRAMFPTQKGFSLTTLKYMKRWYLFYYQSDMFRHQVGDELDVPKKMRKVCIFRCRECADFS